MNIPTPPRLPPTGRDEERSKKEAIEHQMMLDELARFVATPGGMKFVSTVLTLTQVMAVQHASDPSDAAFLAGRRSVGLNLLSLLKAAGAAPSSGALLMEQVA